MITPVVPASVSFIADGVSTAVLVDLSADAYGLKLGGSRPVGVQQLKVGSSAGAVGIAAATVSGAVVTLTFPVAPPMYDGGGALLVYTASFLLELASLPPL